MLVSQRSAPPHQLPSARRTSRQVKVARRSIFQHREALVSQLAGQPCLEPQHGRTIIPLLLPENHDLPFAAAVEVISQSFTTALTHEQKDSDAYELQHILSGSGTIVDHDGNAQQVSAGDSLLLKHGAATLHASQHPDHTDPLVVLTILVPANLLTATADQSKSKASAVSLVNAWGTSIDSAPTLPASTAADLLSLASASIQPPTPPTRTPVASPPPAASPTTSPLSRALSHALPRALSHALPRALSHALPGALSHALSSPLAALLSHFPPPPSPPTPPVTLRSMSDLLAFQMPNQTNRLALAFGPDEIGLRLSFGVEIFQSNHRTPPHIHTAAHELFFVLKGEGVAFCGTPPTRFAVAQGDIVAFPPGSVHGIDNTSEGKLYCLQIMLPNQMFVEFVKSGQAVGRMSDEDLCNLIAVGCSSL